VATTAQTFLQVIVIALASLLALRILVAIPGWVARRRRPERRSIVVVGVGGGGGNATDRMIDAGIPGVGFVACNTDAQALRRSLADVRIRIGDPITHGLGSGGDPEIGRHAAEHDAQTIAAAVAGADLVFVTAGLGGGTGSGAAPIVAAKAREAGALTIAVVTKPFDFEGSRRREIADASATALLAEVDAMITVPNDRVGAVIDEDASALEAFQVVDDVLRQAVAGIVDLLTAPGLINLDFADVRSVVQGAGPALIGLGRGAGERRAVDAARQAIASPLLESSIDGARGILLNVSGPSDLRLREVRDAAELIRASADPRANVIFGASLGEGTDGDVLVTLIATGLAHDGGIPRPADADSSRRTRVAIADAPTDDGSAVEPDRPRTTVPQWSAATTEAPLEAPAFLRRRRPPAGRSRLAEDQALSPRSASQPS
jgi:cell division protein FtsZ